MTRPDFSVAADETPYRRLGAVIREEIYRLVQSSYSFGVQSETGVVRLDVARTVLDGHRDRIYSKLEALLMLIDTMTEMKDVNVTRRDENAPLKTERRSRAKAKPEPVVALEKAADPYAEAPIISIEDPLVDAEAQALVDKVLASVDGSAA